MFSATGQTLSERLELIFSLIAVSSNVLLIF